MRAVSLPPALACIGLAGHYSLSSSSSLHWSALPFGQKPSLHGPSTLYQVISGGQDDWRLADGPLRLALCGIAWLGTRCFGRGPLTELLILQAHLDLARSVRTQLRELDGDFLLCYLPPDLSCCWLYRNVTGMRTLYYRQDTEGLRWSSAIDDLFEERPSLQDVDLALLPWLTAAVFTSPTRTCYHTISCLPAGHGIQAHHDGTITSFVDDFAIPDHQHLAHEEAAEALRFHIGAAMRRKLPGITRAGVLLSGGLDSAIVAKEARPCVEYVRGLHWSWEVLPLFADEKRCAELIAQELGIDLSWVECSQSIAAGGDHLRCTASLALPYHHSFFRAFVATADTAATHRLAAVLSGHLGDLLLHGEQHDGFRATLSVSASFPLGGMLSMIGQLLSCYPRAQAFRLAYDLIRGRMPYTREPLAKRIQQCQDWLTPHAFEQLHSQGEYAYAQVHASPSTQMTYQYVKQEIDANTHLDTDLWQHAFLPHGVLLLHPYADRSLIEFCLGLAPHHRVGFAAGLPISKFLLRFAYLHDLPGPIIGREVRLPYAAVEPFYSRHNQAELQEVLGPDSCLAQLGVIDPERTAVILADSTLLQRYSGSLVPAASVELWLRRIAGHPPVSVASSHVQHRWERTGETRGKNSNGGGLLSFPSSILAKQVNDGWILLNQRTQEVIELNQEASTLVTVMQQETCWPAVMAALRQQGHDDDSDEQALHALAATLQQEGWILLHEPGKSTR